MRHLALALFVAVLVLDTAGCAKLTHVGVADFEHPKGIPYYGGAHYLLVYTDGNGTVITKLLYLTDRTRRMEARPTNVLAQLTAKLDFTNGTLSVSDAQTDSTAIPKALIQAAEKAAAAMAMRSAGPAAGKRVPAPVIYRLVYKVDGGRPALSLVGDEGSNPVVVEAL